LASNVYCASAAVLTASAISSAVITSFMLRYVASESPIDSRVRQRDSARQIQTTVPPRAASAGLESNDGATGTASSSGPSQTEQLSLAIQALRWSPLRWHRKGDFQDTVEERLCMIQDKCPGPREQLLLSIRTDQQHSKRGLMNS
jgi:hypothetical protein